MENLKNNLFIDKDLLKKFIDSQTEYINNTLKNIPCFTHNDFVIHNDLYFDLILEEDKLLNAHIYKDIIKTISAEKLSVYILEDELELLSAKNNPDLFQKHIDFKEVEIIMKRKIDSFFDNKLDDYFIVGKNECNFYFYIELRKEESKEGNIKNLVSEIVVCKKQEKLLDFMSNKFNFMNDIFEIKAQLFNSYLEKKIGNKKITRNKVKV